MRQTGTRSVLTLAALAAILVFMPAKDSRALEPPPDSPTPQDSVQAADALIAQVKDLYGQRRFQDAIPLARRALGNYDHLLGPNHSDSIAAAVYLGGLYRDSQQYSQAVPLFERVLAFTESVLGPEHASTANAIHALAIVYQGAGDNQKAETLCGPGGLRLRVDPQVDRL